MTNFNRQIFNTRRSRLEVIADYALAAIIAACLTMAALAFFDIL